MATMGLFTDPTQLQDARLLQMAQLDPNQRSFMMAARGGQQLGQGIGSLFGVDVQDPAVARATKLRELGAKYGTTTAESLDKIAQELQSSDPQMAMQVAEKANELRLTSSKITAEQALVSQRTAAANKEASSLAMEEKLRKELSTLGPNATEADILKVVTKYGPADKVLAILQSSVDKAASRQQQLELARERIQAQIDMARERGATQAQIAQMQIEGRKEIATLAAALKGEKPLTEYQGKSLTFGTRAAEAHNILNSLEGTYSTLSANYLPSFLNSTEGQRAKQAQENFINAVLRQESGAAISSSEFSNARQQYFPQPGDSQEVLDQKRANRETVIKGFEKQAGPGGVDVRNAFNAAPALKPKPATTKGANQIPTERSPAAAPKTMYASNPKTGERIMSTDGGKTWQQAR